MDLYRILIPFIASLLVAGCGSGGSSGSTIVPSSYTAFTNPELVTVTGYSSNVMEPFLSRDGSFLFFNGDSEIGVNKEIYFASYVDPLTFTFIGKLGNVNSVEVDGTPTMDSANVFYYISTANYTPPGNYETFYSGNFNSGSNNVTGSTMLTGLAIQLAGRVSFDIEVSPDGNTIYIADGVFGSNPFPDEANLAIAKDSGSGFARTVDSDAIMTNLNTADLEYAPAISTNGLELFFTRTILSSGTASIYRSTRNNTSEAFGSPKLVSAITGFVEGPTLSPDEKSLYYHKKVGSVFQLYRVTRP